MFQGKGSPQGVSEACLRMLGPPGFRIEVEGLGFRFSGSVELSESCTEKLRVNAGPHKGPQ